MKKIIRITLVISALFILMGVATASAEPAVVWRLQHNPEACYNLWYTPEGGRVWVGTGLMFVSTSSGNFNIQCNGHWKFGTPVDVLSDQNWEPTQAILASPAQVCAMHPGFCKGNDKHVWMNYENSSELCDLEVVITTDWYTHITPSGQVTGGCKYNPSSP